MKMVMISYNEAIDIEVMDALDICGLKNYTKITGAFGKGVESGTHLGDDIWPGINNILYIACQDKEKDLLMDRVRQMRLSLGKEGIKAFAMSLEEVT